MRTNRIMAGILAMTAMTAGAVSIPFEASAPQWDMIAYSTADGGINIRKSPSASAPRLMIDETKLPDLETPYHEYAFWSSAKPSGTTYPITFTGPAPLVSRNGDWLELSGIGAKGSPAFVSAKYCNVEKVSPITPASTADMKDILMLFDNGDSCFGIYLYPNEMDGDLNLYVGKLINGVLVCPYNLYAIMDSGKSKTSLEKRNGEYFLNLSDAACDEFGTPSLVKLGEEIQKQMIDAATKAEQDKYVYIGPYGLSIF